MLNAQGQASQVHCDGPLLSTGETEGQYTRLEAPGVSTPDWSNGTIIPLGTIITSGLDINYNGIPGENSSISLTGLVLTCSRSGPGPMPTGCL